MKKDLECFIFVAVTTSQLETKPSALKSMESNPRQNEDKPECR